MRSIVIAEDELLLRQALIKQIKTHCDYDVVHESPNGEDALKWLRSHPADILLTDIRMPKMDGIQLLASLKEEQLPVKTIIISGYDDFQYVQQVLRLGAADYLLKPVSCENLHQVLETVSSAIVRQEIDENLQKTALLLELKQSGRYYPSVSVPKLLDPFPTGGITACCFLFYDLCDHADMAHLARQIDLTFPPSCSGCRDNLLYMLAQSADPKGMMDFVQNVLEYISGMGYTCTAGIGDPAGSRLEVGESLRQAENAVLQIDQERGPCIMPYSARLPDKPYSEDYPLSEEQQLLAAVAESDPAQIRQNLGLFFQAVSTWPRDRILRILQEFCFAACREFLQYHVYVDADEFLPLLQPYVDLKTLQNSILQILLKWNAMLQHDHDINCDTVVQSAKEYIRDHAFERLRLDEVSNACFVSKSQFCKIFKDATGTTFKNYLNEIRIRKARQLLQTTALRNYEIAQELGYEDTSYFGEVFKKLTGKTPAEYKKGFEKKAE